MVVPSRFVAGVFRDCGVTAPVEVVPQGVDPAVYSFEERPDRPGLTTLIAGTFTPRKNVREGIAAWKRAFAGDPDARLLIKARFRHGAYSPDDPRIEFVDSEETSRGIAHWYRRADVLLALGNEGFGLALVEGMATGLPVVALATEGQADVCEGAKGLVLPVGAGSWAAFDEPPFGPCGVRAVPDVAAVERHLRWVAGHRAEARAMGRAAAEWVARNRDVWAMGPAVLDVIERRSRPGRVFRRYDTVWAAGGAADFALRAVAGLVARIRPPAPPAPNPTRARAESCISTTLPVRTTKR